MIKKVFLTKIEYYFDYIGKSIPSHFIPTNTGSNIYELPDNHPTIGREILSLGAKNGIVEMVFVFCIFENRSDYGNGFGVILRKQRILGLYMVDDGSDIIFLIKEEYTFAFFDKEKEHDRFFGRHFEFIKN